MRNPHLAYLHDRWDGLLQWRLQGTPRPWREIMKRFLEPDTGMGGPEAAAAPVRISTLVLIHGLEADIRGWLIEAGHHPHPTESPVRLLETLDGLLPSQDPPQGSWAGSVALWASQQAARVQAHLGELSDGQRLKASCPWCWYQSLVVRLLPGVSGQEPEPFIRCESGVCEPGPSEVGSWWEGMPCWPLVQWRWLASRLDEGLVREVA